MTPSPSEQAISLLQLNSLLRETVEDYFTHPIWVSGEFSEARQASNGHFYGELIEKDEESHSARARAKVNCWARTYNILRLRFQQETGQQIQAGINVLILVQVTFHEAYGFSLNMLDIDASYTIGQLMRKRKEIIDQLEADGILHDNQTLPLPTLTQRIAVISAAQAAGYGDFCQHLLHNEYRLRFQVELFPAVMQGQHVEESVLAALMAIADQQELWDVVVIIRGGGAAADLSDFDSYTLGACIAQFPLPVLVGIGHERDLTVLDYVAHKRAKTPTAAADILIEHQLTQLQRIQQLTANLQNQVYHIVENRKQVLRVLAMNLQPAVHSATLMAKHRLQLLSRTLTTAAKSNIKQAQHHTQTLAIRLGPATAITLERQKHRLSLLQEQVKQADPKRILKMGYSLTTLNGNIVSKASQIRHGDVIHTLLAEGEITSVCRKTSTED